MKTFCRHILGKLLIAFCVLAAPSALHAETRIGVIMTADIPHYRLMHEAFVSELNRLNSGGGKIEIILQRPFPDPISWSNAARKLIAFDVDLIVTYGSPATKAVVDEKSRIPQVYAGLYEPEQAGLSGGNLTGCGYKVPLSSIIRYLKKFKSVNTLGILCSGIEEDSMRQYKTMVEFAAQQQIKAEKIDLRSRNDLNKLSSGKWDAVFITGSSLAHLWLNDVLTIFRKEKIPTADIFPYASEEGVLMTLGQPSHFQGQMAAEMASHILRGKKPGSIEPYIYRDTELVFNAVEARHMGISFPVQLLIEATKVIK